MRGVQLIAHRGCPFRFAENSLDGFRSAIDAGALFIETDVQLTADRVPVLFHDNDLQRLCGQIDSIHELRLTELAALRTQTPDHPAAALHSARIPPLAELVELLLERPEVTLFLEIKRIAMAVHGIETVLDATLPPIAPIADRTVVISFAHDALSAARARGVGQIGAVLERWEDREAPILRELAPEYLFCNVLKMPEENPPASLPAPHTRFAVYDITDPEHALRLTRNGITWIESFSIDRLLPVLSETQRRG